MIAPTLPTVRLRGLAYLDATPQQLASLLKDRMTLPQQTTVFTPNAKIAGDVMHDHALYTLLQKADLLLPDGAGIVLASCRFSDRPIAHRLPGIEAGEMALSLAAELSCPVYFLGGKEGVAKEAAAHWQKRLPALSVAGTHHGYFDAGGKDNDAVVQDIRDSGARVLLVCLGFPAQEKWIEQNKSALPSVRLFMGLGGSLDVWSGRIRRAPALFRSVHAEWLWRMLCEPRRFAHLPALVRFVWGR